MKTARRTTRCYVCKAGRLEERNSFGGTYRRCTKTKCPSRRPRRTDDRATTYKAKKLRAERTRPTKRGRPQSGTSPVALLIGVGFFILLILAVAQQHA